MSLWWLGMNQSDTLNIHVNTDLIKQIMSRPWHDTLNTVSSMLGGFFAGSYSHLVKEGY